MHRGGKIVTVRDAHVQQEILRYLDQMPQASQRQLMEFARVLVSEPKGVPGRKLLRYSGILSPEEATEMENAIAEGCERVDLDAW